MHATVTDALDRLTALSEIVTDLDQEPRPGSTGGVEWVTDRGVATQRLTQAADAAESYIWTAHPIPRPPEYLTASLPRDRELLARGIAYRTLYPDTARTQPAEQEWSKAVSELGAEVRTAPAPEIERMVIVDRRMVVLTDHVWGGAGFVVTHGGLVAAFTEVYERQWARAEPWLGGAQRPMTATVTDATSRSILALLWDGKTDSQIASALGMSVRTLNKLTAALYEVSGTTTRFQLGAWWGSDAGTRERAQDAQTAQDAA
ncbi:hypothetical protein [Streptomyces sp. cg36]|uniref:hypothetical protein n=1 Tax=Streptomyces sp. cg36 TaxID=3238798 RepID=UPI0034E2F51B